jgi:hypothetical protein
MSIPALTVAADAAGCGREADAVKEGQTSAGHRRGRSTGRHPVRHLPVAGFARLDTEICDDVVQEMQRLTSWVDREPVHVVVRNGVVTLVGTLDKRSTVEIAERLTFAVPGVVSVANRLEFDYDDTAAIRSRTHESRPAGPGARPRGRPRRESLIDAEAFRYSTSSGLPVSVR